MATMLRSRLTQITQSIPQLRLHVLHSKHCSFSSQWTSMLEVYKPNQLTRQRYHTLKNNKTCSFPSSCRTNIHSWPHVPSVPLRFSSVFHNGVKLGVPNNFVKLTFVRCRSEKQQGSKSTHRTDTVLYILSVLVVFIGLSYASVPLFKMFCRQFGLGGDPELSKGHDKSKVKTMKRVDDRVLKVYFEADKHAAMQWNFQPQQQQIFVRPGETALAFYTAENPTDRPIIGISTYTVVPYKAATYFNKIQCFCFEEQILNPHEKVDMPVFFYIDPEYDNDPDLEFENHLTLSYTFFEAKDGQEIPLPGFMTKKDPTS